MQRAYATLPAVDLTRARDFHEGALGFSAQEDTSGGVLYTTADGNAFLVFSSAGKPSGAYTQLSFQVEERAVISVTRATSFMFVPPVSVAGPASRPAVLSSAVSCLPHRTPAR